MGLGGTIERGKQLVQVQLELAYTGVTRFTATRWHHCRVRRWVVDYLNYGQQRQRIGSGKPFTRLSGVAALYAPGRDYHEWQTAGGSLDESYVVFRAGGPTAAMLRSLVGAKGWCHFRDPDRLIGERLRRVGELAFHRRPGFHLLAHGATVELLGLLAAAPPLTENLREVRAEGQRNDLVGTVERFIREHITEPLRVADIAAQVRMSTSAFAHAYPRLAGESPYRTVQRLKVESAKRLLLQDGLTVKESAARLGFSSEFHFSRLFKRLEGIAPRAYVEALLRRGRGG